MFISKRYITGTEILLINIKVNNLQLLSGIYFQPIIFRKFSTIAIKNTTECWTLDGRNLLDEAIIANCENALAFIRTFCSLVQERRMDEASSSLCSDKPQNRSLHPLDTINECHKEKENAQMSHENCILCGQSDGFHPMLQWKYYATFSMCVCVCSIQTSRLEIMYFVSLLVISLSF